MKRRREQERDEEIAREQAEARREALLADLRARQAVEPEPVNEPEPGNEPEPASGADAEVAPPETASADEDAEALPAD